MNDSIPTSALLVEGNPDDAGLIEAMLAGSGNRPFHVEWVHGLPMHSNGWKEADSRRFRAMSDASPLGIFVSDAEGCCINTNAAYRKISGHYCPVS